MDPSCDAGVRADMRIRFCCSLWEIFLDFVMRLLGDGVDGSAAENYVVRGEGVRWARSRRRWRRARALGYMSASIGP